MAKCFRPQLNYSTSAQIFGETQASDTAALQQSYESRLLERGGGSVTVDSALADDQHTNTLPSQYYKVAPRRGQPRACCFKGHEAPNRG
jgi:hypothetical protein